MNQKQFATNIRKAVLLLQEVLSELDQPPPSMSKTEAKKMASSLICLWCKEPYGELSVHRGVHDTCRAVQKREGYTDPVLMENGLLLEEKPGGRPRKPLPSPVALNIHNMVDEKRKGKAKPKRNDNDS